MRSAGADIKKNWIPKVALPCDGSGPCMKKIRYFTNFNLMVEPESTLQKPDLFYNNGSGLTTLIYDNNFFWQYELPMLFFHANDFYIVIFCVGHIYTRL